MSAYDDGLDILGAVGVARQQLKQFDAGHKQAVTFHKNVAQSVISTGQQIAKKHAKLGNAFVAVGKAASKKAGLGLKKKIVSSLAPIKAGMLSTASPKAMAAAATARPIARAASASSRAATATVAHPSVTAQAAAALRRSIVLGDRTPWKGPPGSAPQQFVPAPADTVYAPIPDNMISTGEEWGPAPTPVEAADLGDIDALGQMISTTMEPLLNKLEEDKTPGSPLAVLAAEGESLYAYIGAALYNQSVEIDAAYARDAAATGA